MGQIIVYTWSAGAIGPRYEEMARDFAKDFYHSEVWHKCRLGYIKHRRSVDGGLCERCGDAPGKIVHHKVHLTPQNIDDPSVALGFDNLQYVCHDCHNAIHGAQIPENAVRYTFDPDGNPIPKKEGIPPCF